MLRGCDELGNGAEEGEEAVEECWGLGERDCRDGAGMEQGSSLFHGLRCSLEDREQEKFHPGEASGNPEEVWVGKQRFCPENPILLKPGMVLLGWVFTFPFGMLPVGSFLKVSSLGWLRSTAQSHPGLFPAGSRRRGSAEGRGDAGFAGKAGILTCPAEARLL